MALSTKEAEKYEVPFDPLFIPLACCRAGYGFGDQEPWHRGPVALRGMLCLPPGLCRRWTRVRRHAATWRIPGHAPRSSTVGPFWMGPTCRWRLQLEEGRSPWSLTSSQTCGLHGGSPPHIGSEAIEQLSNRFWVQYADSQRAHDGYAKNETWKMRTFDDTHLLPSVGHNSVWLRSCLWVFC